MKAVYRKELKSYFVTMSGYVFVAMFFLSNALFFTVNNILMDSDSIANIFFSTCYIMILIVPPLTMRSFAEERKNKTDQMLICAPVSISSVVIGKYLAAITVFGIALIASLVFPILVLFIGSSFYVGETILGYLGCILVGCCLISVGVFISSLSENQLSCAIGTAVALLALYLLDSIGPYIPIPAISNVISMITPYYYLRMFKIGILLPTSVVYLIGFSVFFVLMTIVSQDNRNWHVSAKGGDSDE